MSGEPEVAVLRLAHGEGLPLPTFATAGAAGADLCAAVTSDVIIPPMQRVAVPTGIAVAIPPGFEGQVRPRSGLALRCGVTLANSPGTIDSDYRGEIKVILVNLSDQPFVVRRGERIAQLVVSPVARPRFVARDSLPDSERGTGGFGSTGV